MKVVVINFSGNVGKTTIAAHLLRPRMEDAPIFSVESHNIDAAASGVPVERLRGRKFGELDEQVLQLDSAIVDVGASNVEDFLRLMQQYHGSHDDFDYFVVPVVKDRKPQGDTINTIRSLTSLGVPRERIRVVFNRADPDDALEEEFGALFSMERAEHNCTLRPQAVVYDNEVFDRLRLAGKSLADVTHDDTDYRARLRDARSSEHKDHCLRMVALKRLAITANRNLDQAFGALFS